MSEPSYIPCDQVTSDTTIDEMMKTLEYGPPGPWPPGWKSWNNVHEAHKELLKKFRSEIPPYPVDRYDGRGIVSCVTAKPGNTSGKNLEHGYLPAAWVMVKELRRLGCTLPVTFCHMGPEEWSPDLTETVRPLGVDVIDLRAWEREPGNRFRILSGFESKAAALFASPYEEALFLDADNVPVRNPETLFNHPEFRRSGAIFWPDTAPYDRPDWLPPIVWDAVGLPYDPDHSPDFESGQFIIHKRKAWRALNVSRWLNEHSDRYYAIVFGDKSTFRLGWAVENTPYALPPRGPGWNGGALLQYGMDGGLLFEHCVQNKPTLNGYPKSGCLTHPGEIEDHLAELRKMWDGTLWSGRPGETDQEAEDAIRGRWFVYTRFLGEKGQRRDSRQIRFLEDGRVGKGAAGREFSWSIRNGYLAITGIDGQLTMLLRPDERGVWSGAWLDYERCKVEIRPEELTVAAAPADPDAEDGEG